MAFERSFKTVKDPERADYDAVCVTLFRAGDRICGWFITPNVVNVGDGYVPRSANLEASVAIVRAIDLADALHLDLCIIDPESLWRQVWPLA